jgi:hypothetical protein
MKKIYLFLIIISFLFLSGCTSAPQGDSEFLSTADDFIAAFNSKNAVELNKYVDKEYGFFVIYNPGAFTVAMNLNSFSDVMSLEGTNDVANLKVAKVNCLNPRKGLEPVYSCDNEGWNKTGCFYGTQINRSVAGVYDDMMEYELIDAVVAPGLRDKAAASEKNFAYFVYNTDEEIGLYF